MAASIDHLVVAARSLPERDAPVSEGPGAQQAMAELRKLSESGKSATQSEALGIRRLDLLIVEDVDRRDPVSRELLRIGDQKTREVDRRVCSVVV